MRKVFGMSQRREFFGTQDSRFAGVKDPQNDPIFWSPFFASLSKVGCWDPCRLQQPIFGALEKSTDQILLVFLGKNLPIFRRPKSPEPSLLAHLPKMV